MIRRNDAPPPGVPQYGYGRGVPPYVYGQPPPYGYGQPPPGAPPYGYGQTPPGAPPYGYDQQGNFEMQYEPDPFSDAMVRRKFIRKVYAILSVQLLITAAIVFGFLFDPKLCMWMGDHKYVFYIMLAISLVLMICLSCCETLRRTHPTNIILLALYTIVQGGLLGTISCRYSTDTFLFAVGITTILFIVLTIFAFITKIDFTACAAMMVILGVIIVILGIIAIFVRNKLFRMIYASLGAGIFSLYIVFDTQLMMGGKHKYSLSTDEYVFAALSLYTDVINLLLMILTLFGTGDD